MGPSRVVLVLPRGDHLPRVEEREKPVLVEALIPQPLIEAFDERILDELAGADELQRDADLLRPAYERTAVEFWTVVHDDRGGQPRVLDCTLAMTPLAATHLEIGRHGP